MFGYFTASNSSTFGFMVSQRMSELRILFIFGQNLVSDSPWIINYVSFTQSECESDFFL